MLLGGEAARQGGILPPITGWPPNEEQDHGQETGRPTDLGGGDSSVPLAEGTATLEGQETPQQSREPHPVSIFL